MEDYVMNQEKSEALRAELGYRQHPIELNPQMLKNVFKETGLKPDWQVDVINFWQKIYSLLQQSLEWVWERKVGMSFATSMLVAVVVLLPMLSEPELRPKTFLVPPKIVAFNPQLTAQTLQAELAELGIAATMRAVDEVWIVEAVDLSTDNPDALSALLDEHKLVLPLGESGLKVRIVAE